MSRNRSHLKPQRILCNDGVVRTYHVRREQAPGKAKELREAVRMDIAEEGPQPTRVPPRELTGFGKDLLRAAESDTARLDGVAGIDDYGDATNVLHRLEGGVKIEHEDLVGLFESATRYCGRAFPAVRDRGERHEGSNPEHYSVDNAMNIGSGHTVYSLATLRELREHRDPEEREADMRTARTVVALLPDGVEKASDEQKVLAEMVGRGLTGDNAVSTTERLLGRPKGRFLGLGGSAEERRERLSSMLSEATRKAGAPMEGEDEPADSAVATVHTMNDSPFVTRTMAYDQTDVIGVSGARTPLHDGVPYHGAVAVTGPNKVQAAAIQRMNDLLTPRNEPNVSRSSFAGLMGVDDEGYTWDPSVQRFRGNTRRSPGEPPERITRAPVGEP